MMCRCLLFVMVLLLAPMALNAADQPSVNTICPVSGKPVDSTIPAVIVTVGKGERAKRIAIGVSDRAAADKVKASPAAYVDAAKANRKVD